MSDFIDSARISTIMVGGKNVGNAPTPDTLKEFEVTCEMKEVKSLGVGSDSDFNVSDWLGDSMQPRRVVAVFFLCAALGDCALISSRPHLSGACPLLGSN